MGSSGPRWELGVLESRRSKLWDGALGRRLSVQRARGWIWASEGPVAGLWVTSRHVAAAAGWRPPECQAAESGVST